MDLVSEFFQCSIHEDSIPLTAVCTPGGFSLLCYVCDGFKRVHLFINDIVFFSKNGAEHVDDLERFLERLTIFNLKLAPKKAHIRIRVTKFFGHRVTAKSVEPDPEKVEAMTKLPMPSNVSQLRSLLGALSYYRKILPQMSTVTRPRKNLLQKGANFVTTEHVEIVQSLIKRLSSQYVFAFPDLKAALSGDTFFRLITDASVDGLGAVIEQAQPDLSTRPKIFLSRTKLPNERN